jgi:hypothetical protein
VDALTSVLFPWACLLAHLASRFELFRRAHGFGFATEAGRAVVAAAAPLRATSIRCCCSAQLGQLVIDHVPLGLPFAENEIAVSASENPISRMKRSVPCRRRSRRPPIQVRRSATSQDALGGPRSLGGPDHSRG